MPFKLTTIVTALLLLRAFTALSAEDAGADWYYRAWQTAEGLSDNSVTGVVQSPDGYLWVATKGGLLRFNGSEFSEIPLGEIPGLPSREIRAMYLDNSGSIWLAMERGPIVRIKKNSLHTFDSQDGIPKGVTNSMAEDRQGRLWIAYSNEVIRIEGDEVTNIKTMDSESSSGGMTLACDESGKVWIAGNGRLGRMRDERFEEVHNFGQIPVTIAASAGSGIWIATDNQLLRLKDNGEMRKTADLPKASGATALFEDRDGTVWLGTFAGLFRLEGGAFRSIPTSFHWIDCISQDHKGNIWAGTTGGGLNLVRKRIVRLLKTVDGLPFTSVRSITCDTAGRIWAVSLTGRLAHQEEGKWVDFSGVEKSEKINCVLADSKKRVWIGTRSRGLILVEGGNITRYDSNNGLAGNFIRSILAAENGDVWIATDLPYRLHRLRDGKITQIRHTGFVNEMRAVTEGKDGTVWVGSANGHLLKVAGDRLIREKGVDAVPSIRTLHSTPDGSLWIGYAGEGLGHLKNGKHTRFTTDNGLYDNYISQIQDDGIGSLWITSNRGLFQVKLSELLSHHSSRRSKIHCRVFGRNDGLPSFQPGRDYSPDSCRDPKGRLYFSTSNGLIEVRPGIVNTSDAPTPVVFEKATLDGDTIATYRTRSMPEPGANPARVDLSHPNPKLTLSPGHGRLVISYAALDLVSPRTQKFRYRLKPLDKEWQDLGNNGSVAFKRLPAGNYQFELIASSGGNDWNGSATSLGILVQPYFWETWWFRIGGSALTAFAAGGFVFLAQRQRHRNQLRAIASKNTLERERSRIARDIHDDLGASLTRISLLSQTSNSPGNEVTETVLRQIRDTARQMMRAMDGVVWAIDPDNDSFDGLANYLASHAQEFLNVANLSCRLDMPGELPDLTLTAQIRHNIFLAFKEALNNVVKHSEASEVLISLLPEDGFFTLRIIDNGKGISPDANSLRKRPSPGRGIANMESRMNEIGGTCLLKSTPGKGTCVEFGIPFGNES